MVAALALVLTCLIAGYLCARLGAVPEGGADALNRFVIYVCLPAVVLRLVPKLAWRPGLAVLVVTPWLLVLVSFVLVSGIARVARWSRAVQGALLLCVPLGNTSFLGFPMIEALLGRDALKFAVLYDQLGSFLVLSTYGILVAARFSGMGAPTPRALVMRILRFPPLVALLLARVLPPHPGPVEVVLERLGDSLVPVAMFAVGLKLELRPPKEWGALAFGLSTKMVALPLLALGIARALGAPPLPFRVAVLESAMPPMITAGALATMFGLAPELAAALVGYGVLAAVVVLPLWARLLG